MSASVEDVVVLCGGLGTRLRAAVGDAPKGMAEVGGKPFLEILMDRVASQGFKRFILCTGYRADAIEAHFRGARGRTVLFSREPEPRGTAGALKLCERLCASDPFLVMNGDSLCAVDLRGLLEVHARKGGIGCIAAAPGPRADAGSMTMDAAGRILAFAEKSGGAGLLNAGVYALGREVFAHIPEGVPSSLERDVFPALVPRGLFACPVEGPVYDIGTPERLEAFRGAYLEGFLR